MADTIDVSCPDCKKKLKVPSQHAGKRVKCPDCKGVVSVPAKPAPATKPAAPPPEESGSKPAAPQAGSPDKYKVTWDDETDNDNAAMGVIHEDDSPRCPHCAQLLEPPEAIICIHCGFNNRSRVKVETKKVHEPEAGEWVAHLAPGVIAIIMIVVFLVLDVMCLVNMRYWMEGGMLESDDDGFDGRKKMYVSPGLFVTMAFFVSIVGIYVFIRMGYRRLFVNYLPPEVAMK